MWLQDTEGCMPLASEVTTRMEETVAPSARRTLRNGFFAGLVSIFKTVTGIHTGQKKKAKKQKQYVAIVVMR